VFVQNLGQYLWAGMDKAEPKPFTIFGKKVKLPPGVMQSAAMREDPNNIRPQIGTMMLAVKWMPADSKDGKQEIGQLGLHVKEIKFEPNRVEAPQWKNPFVEVHTYDKDGNEKPIPRWDPRNVLRRGANIVTAGIAYQGAYRDTMLWEQTMRRDALGMLHHKWNSGPDHGWKKKEGKKNNKGSFDGSWCWSDKWGDQYSTENFEFRKECVGAPSTMRHNTISIEACRQITLAICRRSLYFISNRQAMLLADSVFNRGGNTPGIIDAILVPGSHISPDIRNPTELKKLGKSHLDVTHHIIIELEKQCNRHCGSMNLWDERHGDGEQKSLRDLSISDPYLMQDKILWIRYCRAGDGERKQVQIPVGMGGHFTPVCCRMDMETTGSDQGSQMTISKEEFVNCILANPMLSESLRQLSSRDNNTDNLPAWRPIMLQVSITDAEAKQEDDDLFDVLNVRQSVLLEVWDHDTVTHADFLGECWLPPLGTLGPNPRQFVRTLTEASNDLVGTRPDPKKKDVQEKRIDPKISKDPITKDECFNHPSNKKLDEAGKNKHWSSLQRAPDAKRTVSGELTFWASWKLPAKELPPEDAQDLDARVKREEALHTGELYLKIVKAEQLRVADVRRKNGSDPYVCAYVKNECYDATIKEEAALMWRCSQVTGIHECIFKTSYKSRTINPEWNEEKTITLQTGAFEKKTRRTMWQQMYTNRRSKEKVKDDYALNVVKDMGELNIFFGDINKRSKVDTDAGYAHNVEIYMGNTIREFKAKVVEACEQCAQYYEKKERDWQQSGQRGNMPMLKVKDPMGQDRQERVSMGEIAAKYKLVVMNFKHAVTVFCPSERLRSLANQKRADSQEYGRLYRLESNDPSSWQPLDPVCTFEHYQALYGFNIQPRPDANNPGFHAQRLRISEGTEDYKLRNSRYRAFEEQRVKNAQKIEDMNTESACYGYGIYSHQEDGSFEWRAVTADRPEGSDMNSRSFKVQWLYNPSYGTSAAATAAGLEDAREVLEEKYVLLAPHNAKVLGSGHMEHQEFLAMAPDLAKNGKQPQEIAQILNSKLMARFNASQEAPDSEPEDAKDKKKKEETKKPEVQAPQLITVQEVIHHLNFIKMDETGSNAPSGTGSGRNTPRGGSSEAGGTESLAGTRPPASLMSGPSTAYGGPQSTGPPQPAGTQGLGRGPMTTGPPSGTPSGPSIGGGPSRTGPSGPSIGSRPGGYGGGGPQRG